MKKKAVIISLRGTKLSKKEIILLRMKPWGVILFSRNLKSIKQIKELTSKIKYYTKERKFPIIIDEEGLSVSRLRKIINHNISANFFGKLFTKNKTFSTSIYEHYLKSISKILKDLGFNINTIPVVDVLRDYTHKIISDRSFSKDKRIVKKFGDLTIRSLHSNNIGGVIKHIPGHGCSFSDSHKKKPKVWLSLRELNQTDFYPFKLSKAKFAMTAHILYKKLDKNNVASHSKKIIKDIIRKKLGFKGIIISDDISMKALQFDLITNAKKSIEAGCNLVLYCAGKTNENLKLIKMLPYVDEFTSKKTSEFYKFLR